MTTLTHDCETCSSQFKLVYDKEICESDPLHCPFCGEYLLFDETDDEDEGF